MEEDWQVHTWMQRRNNQMHAQARSLNREIVGAEGTCALAMCLLSSWATAAGKSTETDRHNDSRKSQELRINEVASTTLMIARLWYLTLSLPLQSSWSVSLAAKALCETHNAIRSKKASARSTFICSSGLSWSLAAAKMFGAHCRKESAIASNSSPAFSKHWPHGRASSTWTGTPTFLPRLAPNGNA